MPPRFHTALNISGLLLILIAAAIFLLYGCTGPETALQENQKTAPLDVSSGACIDVDGTVLGDPMPDSNVSLYEISNLNFSIVMSEIRAKPSIKWNLMNKTGGFVFTCLSTGNYAFVIPGRSYDGAVGSPLPHEFDCENLSLEIAFQGGDSEYLVGAFSIKQISNDKPACREGPLFCPQRGRLYHECPLGRG